MVSLNQDANRTFMSLLRLLRQGEYETAAELVNTLDPEELSYLAGAGLAIANQLAHAVDDTAQYARTHGAPELRTSGDSVLATIALGYSFPDDGQMHD
jgi:hypothetical protein